MVTIEENSHYMIRQNNEKLIKQIVSEKFKLLHYRKMNRKHAWKMDIYRVKYYIISEYIGFIYSSYDYDFTSIVIGGDKDVFRDVSEKLEANGFRVTIKHPVE